MSVHNKGIYVGDQGNFKADAVVVGDHGVARSTASGDSELVAELRRLIEGLIGELRSGTSALDDTQELVQTAEAAVEELRAPSPRKPRLIELCATLMGGVASVGNLVDLVAKIQHLVLTGL